MNYNKFLSGFIICLVFIVIAMTVTIAVHWLLVKIIIGFSLNASTFIILGILSACIIYGLYEGRK